MLHITGLGVVQEGRLQFSEFLTTAPKNTTANKLKHEFKSSYNSCWQHWVANVLHECRLAYGVMVMSTISQKEWTNSIFKLLHIFITISCRSHWFCWLFGSRNCLRGRLGCFVTRSNFFRKQLWSLKWFLGFLNETLKWNKFECRKLDQLLSRLFGAIPS